jgi:Protein of unknown function (DUF3987)
VEARKTYDTEMAEYRKDWQRWKLHKDAAEARAKSDLKKNPNATIQLEAAEPVEPNERRYVTLVMKTRSSPRIRTAFSPTVMSLCRFSILSTEKSSPQRADSF